MDTSNHVLPSKRQVTYILLLWSEHGLDQPSVWHGSLETMAGQHFNFNTLAELNRLLCELGGWIEPPQFREIQEFHT